MNNKPIYFSIPTEHIIERSKIEHQRKIDYVIEKYEEYKNKRISQGKSAMPQAHYEHEVWNKYTESYTPEQFYEAINEIAQQLEETKEYNFLHFSSELKELFID